MPPLGKMGNVPSDDEPSTYPPFQTTTAFQQQRSTSPPAKPGHSASLTEGALAAATYEYMSDAWEDDKRARSERIRATVMSWGIDLPLFSVEPATWRFRTWLEEQEENVWQFGARTRSFYSLSPLGFVINAESLSDPLEQRWDRRGQTASRRIAAQEVQPIARDGRRRDSLTRQARMRRNSSTYVQSLSRANIFPAAASSPYSAPHATTHDLQCSSANDFFNGSDLVVSNLLDRS